MTIRRKWVVLTLIGALGTGVYWLYSVRPAWGPFAQVKRAEPNGNQHLGVSLVEGSPNTLLVPIQVREALGISEAAAARAPATGRQMILPGSIALDPSRLYRIRSRFNAEVREMKQRPDEQPKQTTTDKSKTRDIRAGDKVIAGDVLAVLWSGDVGSKKSELVTAILQLRLDEKRLKDRYALWKDGSIPEDTLNQTRRDVTTDAFAVEGAERTLRDVYKINDEEIEAVRAEAKEILQREGKRDEAKEKLWPRSELKAPKGGTIVERNLGIGEILNDTTQILFTIADVSRMLVVAYPSEDQLKELLDLTPAEREWTISAVNSPDVKGSIDEISQILDPNLHTGVVKGYIDNPDERLRAGQYITVTVESRPPANVVEVESTALVEDGKYSYVFVQADAKEQHYTLRRVIVKQRFEQKAYVASELNLKDQLVTDEEKKKGVQPPQPLHPGDRYLKTGALELRAALDDRLAKVRSSR